MFHVKATNPRNREEWISFKVETMEKFIERLEYLRKEYPSYYKEYYYMMGDKKYYLTITEALEKRE